MGAVTVIAPGSGGISETGNLAVLGIKIAFSQLLMTTAALPEYLLAETLGIDPDNGVRLMAIIARW